MSNIYNIDNINQTQKQKSNKPNEPNPNEPTNINLNTSQNNEDTSIIQQAEQIEHQNYNEANNIKKQLTQAHLNQKEATNEMKRQTETLSHTKKSAHGIHQEAQKGESLADDIDREGRIFSCRFACIDKLCRWFRKTEVKDEKEKTYDEPEVKYEEYKDEDEFVPGQNQTDKELVGVLNVVRGIRQQAEVQSNEADKQKICIGDIKNVNEESEKVIKRTDEHLKKID